MNTISPLVRNYFFRWIVSVSTAVAIIGTFLYIPKILLNIPDDFFVYYKASQNIVNGHLNDLYALSPMPFRYTPSTLVIFAPLARYPETVARAIWGFIQIFSWIGSAILLRRSLENLGFRYAREAVAVSFLLIARHYLDSLWCGQVVGLIAIAFATSFYFFSTGRPSLALIGLVFPTMLKITPLYIAAFVLFHSCRNRKDWAKKILTLILAIAVFSEVSALISKIDTLAEFKTLWQHWWAIVVAEDRYFDNRAPVSQSILSMAWRLFGNESIAKTIWWISGVSLTAFSIRIGLRTQLNRRFASIFLLLNIGLKVLLMPQALPYSYSLMFFPLAAYSVLLMEKKFEFGTFWTQRKAYLPILFFALVASIPGSSVVGYPMAEWLRRASMPFFAISIILFAAFHALIIAIRQRQQPIQQLNTGNSRPSASKNNKFDVAT